LPKEEPLPVTPLHFGVGLAGKALALRWLSLSAFVVSQLVIDTEVAYYMLIRRQWPYHRWAHTFLIGGAIGLAVGAAVCVVGALLWRLRRRFTGPDLHELGWIPCLLGGLLGGLSHPVLDGILFDGVAPFRPFSKVNPFLGWLGASSLEAGLVVTGVLGVLGLFYRLRRMDCGPDEE
jgi:membrane-bound metal-dependent hydrolase YbcI (DUF457 family)